MRELLLMLAIWVTIPAADQQKQLTSEDAPCFAEVTLVSGTPRGAWLTLKRTNLDSCAFEPFDTIISVSPDLEPRILKTKKGWEITFTKSL
jgi:hypothetical protein